MSATPGGGRGARILFLAVTAAALAVRLVHVWGFSSGNPFFDPAPWNTPTNPMDPGEYDRWGMQITHGDPWWTDHGQGHYFQSPVYPYFVAGLYLLMGGRSVLGVVVVQLVFGALTCGLLALMARRLGGAVAGWMAGLTAALYGPALFYESFLLKEPLATFLVVAALAATLREFGADGPRSRPADGRRWPAWLGVGALWGAAVAAWPPLAVVAVPSAAWGVWRLDRGGEAGAGRRPAPVAAGLILCGALAAILPCTVRNVVGEGRFVLISDAGPRNWDVGNSANSTGTYIDFPRQRLSPASLAFWRLYVRKVGLFLQAPEIPQVTDYELLRQASPVLRLPLPGFGFVAPFGLLGLALAWRRWRELLPLYALAVGYPLAISLFFVVGRFRLPAIPALILFAALAAEDLRGAARAVRRGARRWAPVAAALAGLVLAALAVNRGSGVPRGAYPFHHAWARYHLDLGEIAVANGRAGDALAAYEKVLRLPTRPYRAMARAGRAGVYLGLQDRPDLALEEMRRSLAEDPQQAEAERAREVIRKLEERLGGGGAAPPVN